MNLAKALEEIEKELLVLVNKNKELEEYIES